MVNFKTMLAQKTDPKRIDFAKNDYYVQPKLDGVRCYITKDGMFSRNHKPIISAPHIREQFDYLFDEYGDAVILDGELYNHEYKDNFNKIISLVRKTKPTQEDLNESALKVEFHCYDFYPIGDPGMIFSDRLEFLRREVWSNLGAVAVETHFVADMDQATKFNQVWLDAGYEGSMIRQDAEYQQKRSWYLQKVKTFVDAEFKIVGFEERMTYPKREVDGKMVPDTRVGMGKPTGKLGKFIMEMPDGRTFGAPPGKGYDFAKLVDMFNNIDDYIGEMATVEFFELTPSGIPRFPKYKALRNYE